MAQYINIDRIVAEIERLKSKFYYEPETFKDVGAKIALDSLKSSLDTLGVKEVNLEKEIETLDSLLYDLDGVAVKGATHYLTVEDVKDIAKYFYELGLAQKGE